MCSLSHSLNFLIEFQFFFLMKPDNITWHIWQVPVKNLFYNKLLTLAFWFISGSLACRNQGRSGHRKSPVEWAAVASQTTRVYSCPGTQRPKVHKSWKLNGTVGPIGTCKKPKPGRLDLMPNRALFRHSTARPLPRRLSSSVDRSF